jgi:hypothetical protein
MLNIAQDSPPPTEGGEEEGGVNKEGDVDVSADPDRAGPSVVCFQPLRTCACFYFQNICFLPEHVTKLPAQEAGEDCGLNKEGGVDQKIIKDGLGATSAAPSKKEIKKRTNRKRNELNIDMNDSSGKRKTRASHKKPTR